MKTEIELNREEYSKLNKICNKRNIFLKIKYFFFFLIKKKKYFNI